MIVPNVPPIYYNPNTDSSQVPVKGASVKDVWGRPYKDSWILNSNLPRKRVYFNVLSDVLGTNPVDCKLSFYRNGSLEFELPFQYRSTAVAGANKLNIRPFGNSRTTLFENPGATNIIKTGPHCITTMKNVTNTGGTAMYQYCHGIEVTTLANVVYLDITEPKNGIQGNAADNNYSWLQMFEVREFSLGYKIRNGHYRL